MNNFGFKIHVLALVTIGCWLLRWEEIDSIERSTKSWISLVDAEKGSQVRRWDKKFKEDSEMKSKGEMTKEVDEMALGSSDMTLNTGSVGLGEGKPLDKDTEVWEDLIGKVDSETNMSWWE